MRLMTACTALVLAAAAAGASAGEIYTWKDASGVTNFSDSPPPAGTAHEVRRVSDAGVSRPASSDPAPPAAEDPQCTTARANIELLNGEAPVLQDVGEGQTRALDPDERASQLELARAAVRAYCKD